MKFSCYLSDDESQHIFKGKYGEILIVGTVQHMSS